MMLSVLKLISENHDLQVRFRWSANDVAIWDKYVSLPCLTACGKRIANPYQSLGLPYCNIVSSQQLLTASEKSY